MAKRTNRTCRALSTAEKVDLQASMGKHVWGSLKPTPFRENERVEALYHTTWYLATIVSIQQGPPPGGAVLKRRTSVSKGIGTESRNGEGQNQQYYEVLYEGSKKVQEIVHASKIRRSGGRIIDGHPCRGIAGPDPSALPTEKAKRGGGRVRKGTKKLPSLPPAARSDSTSPITSPRGGGGSEENEVGGYEDENNGNEAATPQPQPLHPALAMLAHAFKQKSNTSLQPINNNYNRGSADPPGSPAAVNRFPPPTRPTRTLTSAAGAPPPSISPRNTNESSNTNRVSSPNQNPRPPRALSVALPSQSSPPSPGATSPPSANSRAKLSMSSGFVSAAPPRPARMSVRSTQELEVMALIELENEKELERERQRAQSAPPSENNNHNNNAPHNGHHNGNTGEQQQQQGAPRRITPVALPPLVIQRKGSGELAQGASKPPPHQQQQPQQPQQQGPSAPAGGPQQGGGGGPMMVRRQSAPVNIHGKDPRTTSATGASAEGTLAAPPAKALMRNISGDGLRTSGGMLNQQQPTAAPTSAHRRPTRAAPTKPVPTSPVEPVAPAASPPTGTNTNDNEDTNGHMQQEEAESKEVASVSPNNTPRSAQEEPSLAPATESAPTLDPTPAPETLTQAPAPTTILDDGTSADHVIGPEITTTPASSLRSSSGSKEDVRMKVEEIRRRQEEKKLQQQPVAAATSVHRRPTVTRPVSSMVVEGTAVTSSPMLAARTPPPKPPAANTAKAG